MFFVGESSPWLKDLTTRWNTRASIQQLLILHVTPRSFRDLQLSLDRNDAVMAVVSSRNVDRFMAIRKWIAGSADFTWVEIEEEGRGPQWPTWRYRVPSAELQEEGSDTFFKAFDRRRYPTLDAIARWITRREIGLSMSAGAAMGFAHLGVIQVLKREGIPIDCVTGASMGGIVALAYGMNGDIDETVRRLRETLGSNRKVRDVTFFPTSSFFAGKKIRLAARRTFGDALITDSRIPSAVVSTDLVHGERVIIDSGPVTEAMLATSAIPAAFPPVVQNDRILVDGALVSRIPVGLLGRRRCGLTIAVNVVPFLGERSGAESSERVKRLRQKFARFFGFREVLASSWVLLGWWQGARDAQDADILLEPNTELFSALNFDRFDEIVTEGRRAAEEKLDLILAATSMVLKPGVP
jgi:NTE family protein